MLRALLVFTAVSTVFSQNCQLLKNFRHNDALLKELNGTFFAILTSSEKVFDCEKMTWSGKDSELQATIQSPGCCRRVHSPQYFSDHVDFTVDPITTGPTCLQVSESVAFKVISTTGTGGNLCITFTACRLERQGVYEICREQIVQQTVVDTLLIFLQNLLGAILNLLQGLPALVYKRVKQADCVFPVNNCGP